MATLLHSGRLTYYVTSGTSNPGNGSQDLRGKIVTYLESQDPATNTSYIRIDHYSVHYARTTENQYVGMQDLKVRCNIGSYGGTYQSKSLGEKVYSRTAGTTTNISLGSTYHTVYHNSDGTGTLYVNAVYEAKPWGYTFNTQGCSLSVTLPTIPRGTTIKSFTWAKASGAAGLSRLTCSWSTANSIDRIQYSLNGGAYTTVTGSGTSGSFNISSLTPNTQYSMKIKVRRADSQVETQSGTLYATTYDIAKITATPNNNINIENNASITYTNPSGGATRISLYKTDASTPIAGYRSCTGTNYEFVFTSGEKNTFYSQIPNSKTLPLRFYLQTSDGLGGYWGHYVERTFEVFDANPIFTTWTYADTNATTVALTGNNQNIIKNYSNVNAIVTAENKATAQKGATMSYYLLTIGEKTKQVNWSSTETVNLLINNVDNSTFTLDAVDSRGNATRITKSATMINYVTPIISAGTATRTDNIEKETTLAYNGQFFGSTFGSVTNTIKTATYEYKITTDSSYTTGSTSVLPTESDNTFSLSKLIAGDDGANGFLQTNSYNIRITITDELSSAVFNLILGTGRPNLAIHKEGVAINGVYDTNLGGALQVNGTVYVNSKSLLDMFYPIGTIYETTSSNLDTTAKMANHFGGTWEVYGAGRVLVAKSSETEFDTIGKTGGAKTHTLTVNEMPNHNHTGGILTDNQVSGGGRYYFQLSGATNGTNFSNSLKIGETGGGQAHNNLQPYIVVYRYRRTL